MVLQTWLKLQIEFYVLNTILNNNLYWALHLGYKFWVTVILSQNEKLILVIIKKKIQFECASVEHLLLVVMLVVLNCHGKSCATWPSLLLDRSRLILHLAVNFNHRVGTFDGISILSDSWFPLHLLHSRLSLGIMHLYNMLLVGFWTMWVCIEIKMSAPPSFDVPRCCLLVEVCVLSWFCTRMSRSWIVCLCTLFVLGSSCW